MLILKRFFILLLFAAPFLLMAQSEADYDRLDSLVSAGLTEEAYRFTKDMYLGTKPSDTSFLDAMIVYFSMADYYQRELWMGESYQKAIEVNQERLDLIHKYKKLFNKEFAEQEYFIYRNMAVCYTGLGDYAHAQKYRDMLYAAQKKGKLPCEFELCHYFNFDFFKVDTLNVWGYEWYDQLPKDRFSTSFTKIVYYVYSTDASGNDKDQLYRLHVLMFHGTGQPFDYIMDKHISTKDGEISGSMYAYTYNEKIDFKKLHNDVLEIVRENKKTDTQRFTRVRD
jgi:tetratricopeptide (TPR) repeat protein